VSLPTLTIWQAPLWGDFTIVDKGALALIAILFGYWISRKLDQYGGYRVFPPFPKRLRMPRAIPFRTFSTVLLLALLTGLYFAREYTPQFQQARLIALLRPLVNERTDILSATRFTGLQGVEIFGRDLTDDEREHAINRYPALINRIRALHPEIRSEIRDRIARLLELELGYLRAFRELTKASNSMGELAKRSCSQEREVFTFDPIVEDLPAIVSYQQLHAAKLKLAQATLEVEAKIQPIHREDDAIFKNAKFNNGPLQIAWAPLLDDFYLSGVKDWLQAPRTNCAGQEPPVSELNSREKFLRLWKLPCVCGKRDP
jgi:hypothetical protein